MLTRVRLASVVFVLLSVLANTASAQAPDSARANNPMATGRGSIGGQAGLLWLIAGGDFSKGAQPRLSFSGHFRYMISPAWRWQVSPYFGWNAYRTGEPAPYPDLNHPADVDKDHMITEIAGGAAQLQRVSAHGRTRWHVGVGPAVYRIVVEDQRKVSADPLSLERHHTTHLGATAELGWERFMKALPNTSVEWTFAYQTAFAADKTKFPSGWNDSPGGVEFRLGAHYYYNFDRNKKPAVSTKPGLGR